jgi:uncharacterized repeat protein (TIGR02543 family)
MKKNLNAMWFLALIFLSIPLTVNAADTSVSDYAGLSSAISSAPAGGYVIGIDASFSLAGTITIPSGTDITLIGNAPGYTLTAGSSGRHFIVNGGLTLENITLDGDSNGVNNRGGIYVSGGTLIMNENSVITNCGAAVDGAGIFLTNSSSFIMNGGIISNNKKTNTFAGSGGGVHVAGASSFTMNDGKITGNSSIQGGGVSVGDGGTFTMHKGEISRNIATTQYGGGVFVFANGTFTLNDGVISGNTATAGASLGGGVFAGGGGAPDVSKFTMNGGAITQNSAVIGGGIGSMYNGQITVNGGLISKNTAKAGGGVCVAYPSQSNPGLFSIFSDVFSTDQYPAGANPSSGNAALYFKMTGGEIADNINTAEYYGGGGIFAYDMGAQYTLNVIIDGSANPVAPPLIHGNQSGTVGGGIYELGGNVKVDIVTAKIYENSAQTSGGGIYIDGSALSITRAEISGNTAQSNGGGIYIKNNVAAIHLTGATSISGNSAVNEGGGIFSEKYTGYPGGYSGVATGDYANIMSDPDTIFSGNTAAAAYMPVDNADTWFSTIGYAASSISAGANYLNPVNNFDINYVEPQKKLALIGFDANGGSGSYTDAALAGSPYTVPDLIATGISYAGFDFTGWNTSADGSGADYSAGAIFTPTSDVMLYAQWKPKLSSATPVPALDANGLLLLALFTLLLGGMTAAKYGRRED